MTISRKLNKYLTTTIIALLVLSTFTILYSAQGAVAGTIALSPAAGQPASTVTVTGGAGNFTAGETVYVYFQGTALPVANAVAAGDGSATATFTVPSVAKGAYTVTASGATSGNSYATTFTVVAPTVAVDYNATSAGANVTLTLTNFAQGAIVRVTFDGVSWVNTTALASGNGTITALVPTKAAGVYTISATDGINSATAGFTILSEAITLAPSSGPTNAAVVVSGSGFPIGSLVLIYGAGNLLTSVSANGYGNFTKTITIAAATAVTAYLVQAQDYLGNVASATYTITTPAIKVAPTKGPSGATAIINGTSFKASSLVTINIDGASLTTATSGPDGAVANVTVTIPGLASGAHTISASDGIYNVTATFTVNAPKITLTPTGGANSTTITVAGTNFKVSSTVTIFFGPSIYNWTVATDAAGAFSTTITSPSVATGLYTVNATDSYNYATATFNVGPTVLTATSGTAIVPAAKVTVTGAGFSPNGTVSISVDGVVVNSTVTASSTGTLTGVFTVPDLASGKHNITAYDAGTGITSVNFEFTVAAPTITPSATTGTQVGQFITLTGTNFKLGAPVSIIFNGVTITTTKATATGALVPSANFTVPSVLPGTYYLNATDGVNQAAVTINVVGTGNIDQVITIVTAIQTTLATNGDFYNFTNNWFTTINAKLGTFTGEDTVASLLYSIQNKLNIPSGELKFAFGGATTAYDPAYTYIANTTVYGANGVNWGWTDASGMQWRDRTTAPTAVTRTFINGFTASKVFQVALPNGNYIVSVTQGDSAYGHDKMTIIANGELVANTDTQAGQFAQNTFSVTVENGLLQLTFGKAAGATDGNWVVNAVTIQQQP